MQDAYLSPLSLVACAWLLVCARTISDQMCSYYNWLPAALVFVYYITGCLCLGAAL